MAELARLPAGEPIPADELAIIEALAAWQAERDYAAAAHADPSHQARAALQMPNLRDPK
ncbi:MAG TPA: hypothetical protein VFA50_15060 [Stellaceae bacterium]|nr:hypothetical protein [Stellaceae bacterium]